MLSAQERDLLTEKLLVVIARAPAPRLAIVSYLDNDLAAQLPEGLPAELVVCALDLCVKDGYGRTPPQLLNLVINLLPGDQEIAGIVARLRAPPPPAPDPFEARILDSKLPFLDRKQARAFFKVLAQARPSQPVVVVVGDSKMGKSYTFEFIDHVCYRAGIELSRVQLNQREGSSIGPGELARELVTHVGGEPRQMPEPMTNLDRWAQELANWIVAEANRNGSRWWFVLDGFNKQELRDDTSLLIVKLSIALQAGVARKHRLILLDFDRTLLPLRPGLIASETTTPIPRSAVEMVVADLIRASGKSLDSRQVTAKIMDGFPDPVPNLPELNFRICDFMETAGV